MDYQDAANALQGLSDLLRPSVSEETTTANVGAFERPLGAPRRANPPPISYDEVKKLIDRLEKAAKK